MRLSGQGRRVSMGARTRGAPWSDFAFGKGSGARGWAPGSALHCASRAVAASFTFLYLGDAAANAARFPVAPAVGRGPQPCRAGARAARFSGQWKGFPAPARAERTFHAALRRPSSGLLAVLGDECKRVPCQVLADLV